jgi:DNA polymerase-1
MAVDLYGFDEKYCGDGCYDPTGTFQPRKRAKTGLLAVCYGTSKFTLAQQMRISVDEAEAFIDQFYNTYKDVKRYIDETHAFLLRNGYVETKLGRKRRFPELAQWVEVKHRLERKRTLTESEREQLREARKYVNGMLRAGLNFTIQGFASQIIKLLMIEMYKLCQKYGWRMAASIHDEIVLLVPDTITPEQVMEVERVMTQTVKLAVPIKADTVIGPSFGEQYPWREWFEMNKQKEAV